MRSHSATRDAARDTVEWARECEARGAGELLVTSIDRDGTRNGYDLELLARLRDAVLAAGDRVGRRRQRARTSPTRSSVAEAALLASILHEQPARLVSLRDELRELGVPLRDAA